MFRTAIAVVGLVLALPGAILALRQLRKRKDPPEPPAPCVGPISIDLVEFMDD